MAVETSSSSDEGDLEIGREEPSGMFSAIIADVSQPSMLRRRRAKLVTSDGVREAAREQSFRRAYSLWSNFQGRGITDLSIRSCSVDSNGSGASSRYSDFEELMEAKAMRASRIKDKATRECPAARRYYGNLALAVSVGFCVMLLSMPLFITEWHYRLFGQRGSFWKDRLEVMYLRENPDANLTQFDSTLQATCLPHHTGQMRNVAVDGELPRLKTYVPGMDGLQWDIENSTDIWCGLLPEAWSNYWPNAAQFIVFSVYTKTGTTMRQSFEGLLGTGLAVLNMGILQLALPWLFPNGAHSHDCISGVDMDLQDGKNSTHSGLFVVISYDHGGWTIRTATTLLQAVKYYMEVDDATSEGQAIFWPGGQGVDAVYQRFPAGRIDAFKQKYQELMTEDCERGETVYDDLNFGRYGFGIAMTDYIIVVLLFLLSNSSSNTIMWGLSWHTAFIMDLLKLDANYVSTLTGSSCFVVFCTACIGAVLAVASTFVPFVDLHNLSQLFSDAMVVTDSITNVWDDSLEYVASGSRSTLCLKIQTRIDSLDKITEKASLNLCGAWWETLLRPRARRRRDLLALFGEQICSIKDVVFIVKSTVLSEQFSSKQKDYFKKLEMHMWPIVQETSQLMWLCLQACEDGVIDDFEKKQVLMQVQVVLDHQSIFRQKFHELAPPLRSDLSEAFTFTFALSYYSRRIVEMAECILEVGEAGEAGGGGGGGGPARSACPVSLICQAMRSGISETWRPSELFAHHKLKYCFQNTLSITLCFVMGVYLEHGIFTKYNSTMAVTLSLLQIRDRSHHVEYEKAMQRLLGVVMGKCLPMIITAFYVILGCGCGTQLRNIAQGAGITGMVSLFLFICFASSTWSYVACLIAGFSIYGLVEACGKVTDETMLTRYREIGNVIVAIVIQALLHVLFSSRPRKLFLKRSALLFSHLSRSFESLFLEGDRAAMKESVGKTEHYLGHLKRLGLESDPKVVLVHGRGVDFNMDLYNVVIPSLESLVHELHLLDVVASDYVALTPGKTEKREDDAPPSLEEEEEGRPTSASSILDFLIADCRAATVAVVEILQTSQATLAEVIPHMFSAVYREEEGDDEKVEAVVPTTGFYRLTSRLYAELAIATATWIFAKDEITEDIRIRLAIIVRSLERTAYHLGKIARQCSKECIQQQAL